MSYGALVLERIEFWRVRPIWVWGSSLLKVFSGAPKHLDAISGCPEEEVAAVTKQATHLSGSVTVIHG